MGLSLKDSPPGFDLRAASDSYGDEAEDEDESFAETEQY
jgi:DNA-directed RNA polymerase subunit alpha